jgi:hypothetical protein
MAERDFLLSLQDRVCSLFSVFLAENKAGKFLIKENPAGNAAGFLLMGLNPVSIFS